MKTELHNIEREYRNKLAQVEKQKKRKIEMFVKRWLKANNKYKPGDILIYHGSKDDTVRVINVTAFVDSNLDPIAKYMVESQAGYDYSINLYGYQLDRLEKARYISRKDWISSRFLDWALNKAHKERALGGPINVAEAMYEFHYHNDPEPLEIAAQRFADNNNLSPREVKSAAKYITHIYFNHYNPAE